jgi:S1-C subfamily serine protease
MKMWRWQILRIITAMGLSSLPVGLAQSDSIDAQMNVVVKLRIHRTAQATEETAAGIFVGKDRQNVYFITACHAVTQKDKDDNVVRVYSVQLQFHNSPQNFKALVFERYEPELDLAVVQIPFADLPQDIPEITRKDAALGVPIHVIGHPAAGDWSIAAGTVQNLNTATGDIHHFITSRDNSLAEGHSGGPVFDSQGALLGMHTASGPTYGVEAKSAEIMNQLAAWRVPTNNLSTVAPDAANAGLQADRDAINGVIDAYVDSYQRKDAQTLWKIWPNAPDKTKQAIKNYFDSAQSINMKVIERRVETNGSNATVMGQSFQEFKPRNGSTLKSPESPITVELEKRNGTWLITLVR